MEKRGFGRAYGREKSLATRFARIITKGIARCRESTEEKTRVKEYKVIGDNRSRLIERDSSASQGNESKESEKSDRKIVVGSL